MAALPNSSVAHASAVDLQRSRIDYWLVPVLLLIALMLRLYALNTRSFWADELDQILHGQESFIHTIGAGLPPIDYLITRFISNYIGKSEFIVRFADVVWGELTILFVYKLGCYWFDRPVAYLASFVLAILPIHIQYSREARYYSLPTLLFVLCLYTCVLALDKRTRQAWLTYILFSFLALFTQFYAAPFLALLSIWVLFIKRPPLNVLLVYVVTTAIPGLLFLTWAFVDRNAFPYARASWAFPFPFLVIDAVFFDMSQYIQLQTYYPMRETLTQAFVDAIIASFWCIIFLWTLPMYVLFGIVRRRFSKVFSQKLAALSLILYGGIVSALVVPWLAQSFFAPRYVVFYSPFMCLIISATYLYIIRSSRLTFWRRKLGRHFLSGASVAFFGLCAAIFWTPLMNVYNAPVQDWRDLATTLVSGIGPNDILISPFTTFLGYYQPSLLTKAPPGMIEPASGLYTPGYPENMPKDLAEINSLVQKHSGLWIILIEGDAYQHPPALLDFIKANQLQPRVFSQALEIYHYVAPHF